MFHDMFHVTRVKKSEKSKISLFLAQHSLPPRHEKNIISPVSVAGEDERERLIEKVSQTEEEREKHTHARTTLSVV